jgi:CDP-diacylglycerol---serine O-phosphatidyltransferase
MNINKYTKHIPNFLTTVNLFCGCMAIVASFKFQFNLAFTWIMIAAVFDFSDGFAARLLKAYSEYGKIIDSLADMVSFGIAPATILYNLFIQVFIRNYYLFGIPLKGIGESIIISSTFLIAVFSALRLAKFHLDTRQHESFIGLPTPANAIFISSLAAVLVKTSNPAIFTLLFNFSFLFPMLIMLCYLLISEIPMFSLKFKNYNLKENSLRYAFMALSLFLIFTIQLFSFPIIILLYILLSLLQNYMLKTKISNNAISS